MMRVVPRAFLGVARRLMILEKTGWSSGIEPRPLLQFASRFSIGHTAIAKSAEPLYWKHPATCTSKCLAVKAARYHLKTQSSSARSATRANIAIEIRVGGENTMAQRCSFCGRTRKQHGGKPCVD